MRSEPSQVAVFDKPEKHINEIPNFTRAIP
jgi:hypothetical protein